MKIAVNKCFGGFSINNVALLELVKRGAKCVKQYTPKEYYGGNNKTNPRKDWEAEWKKDFEKWYKPIGDGFYENTFLGGITKDGILYDFDRDSRTDPDLISLIEEMGDKINGTCSRLRITEIPDGVDWEINEYDGMESVHEKHRSW